jgi:hypothetical protein
MQLLGNLFILYIDGDPWFTIYLPSQVEVVTAATKAKVDAIYINPKIFYFYSGNEIKDVSSKVMWRGNDDNRNNFAPISNIISTICDHDAFCLGSLGANYLKGGSTPRLEEVRRCVHTSHDH